MKVCGHPRSGNHFLASAIHRAFYDSDKRFAFRVSSAATGHWSQRHPGVTESFGDVSAESSVVPWGHLIGSHSLQPPAGGGEPIYVYRDGRDVALSIYNWTRFRSASEQGLSLSRYLRRPIDWIGSPGYRAQRRYLLWEHWKTHVGYWLAREDILAVRYEDLVQDLPGQLSRIAERFGVPLLTSVDGDVAVGWKASAASREERLGRWRGRLNASDLALYDNFVPQDFAGRWNPKTSTDACESKAPPSQRQE